MSESLKLDAMVPEDLKILAAACVGAITSPDEISYSAKSRHFTLTCSRLMWEAQTGDNSGSMRTRSGLFFADILSVKSVGYPNSAPDTAMELLSVSETAEEGGNVIIQLDFAGGSSIALTAECINASLTDAGDPWHTKHTPTHENGD